MTTIRVVGECFFWYRLTRVFPDKFHRAVKRLCVCVCVAFLSGVSRLGRVPEKEPLEITEAGCYICIICQSCHTTNNNESLKSLTLCIVHYFDFASCYYAMCICRIQ